MSHLSRHFAASQVEVGIAVVRNSIEDHRMLEQELRGVFADLSLSEVEAKELVLSQPWGAALAGAGEPGFYVVHAGVVWIAVHGRAPVLLREGDIAVLPKGSPHVLTSHPEVRAIDVREFCAMASMDARGNVVGGGGKGAATRLEAHCFRAHPLHVRAVMDFAPPLVVLGANARPWIQHIRRALDAMRDAPGELCDGARARLSEILFSSALREASLLSATEDARDPTIAGLQVIIRARPEHPWSVAEMAKRAAMSRTVFCDRFARATGESPARFVTRARMEHAAAALRRGAQVEEVAVMVGYGSAAAFGAAFRRWYGTSPGRFVREPRL